MTSPGDSSCSAQSGEGEFKGFDGLRLFFRWQRPAKPRAAVLLVHGLAEHSGRYLSLATELAGAGFSYYGYDQRGHGRSDGRPGDVNHFSDYIADLQLFREQVERRAEGLPLLLVGHSLGGIVASLAATERSAGLAGLVTTSAVFRLHSPPPKASIVGACVLSRLLPGFRVANGLRPEQLSSDPEVVASNLKDPLVQRKVTLRWVCEFFSSYQEALLGAGKLTLPVLVLHGEADQIACFEGSRMFYQRVSSKDRSLCLYPGLKHELFNERPDARAQVLAEFLFWLSQHSQQ